MKGVWRNLLSGVFAFVLVFSLVLPFARVNAVGIDIDESLLQRGYPQIVLDLMDDQTKQAIFESAEEFAGGVLAYFDDDGNVVEVSIDEDGSYIMPRGQISASDLALSLTYSRQKTDGVLDYIRVILSYTWQNLPLYRYQDAISVGWDENLFQITESDFYKIDKYSGYYLDMNSNPVYVNNQIQSEEYGYGNATSSGVTWYADLKGHLGIVPTALWGSGSFILDARVQTESGSSKLYANYFHKASNGSLSINFGSYGGISVSGDGDERGINKDISW